MTKATDRSGVVCLFRAAARWAVVALGTLAGGMVAQGQWVACSGTGSVTCTTSGAGIGTTSPQQQLDVQGNIAIAGNTLGGGNGGWGADGAASFATLQVYNAQSGYSILNNQTFGIRLQTAGTPRLTVLNDGNVGIGTTNPQYPLAVNGTVQAKEVLVNSNWSDYVFESGLPAAAFERSGGVHRSESSFAGDSFGG